MLLIRRFLRFKTSKSHAKFEADQIDCYAQLPITPITLKGTLKVGITKDLILSGEYPVTQPKIIQSANYLIQELPVRLARRLRSIHQLPYIVGMNPYIRSVYKLYHYSFTKLKDFQVRTEEQEAEFTETLRDLIDQHSDVIPKLARGMAESSKYMRKEDITAFLDGMIQARIGIRVIAEHHIALHDKASSEHYSGIINHRMSPVKIIHEIIPVVQELCELNYGSYPEVVLKGDLDAKFPYIDVHLEYMIMELLKNSFRATVEWSRKIQRVEDPSIEILIGSGKKDVSIRIRDMGGGINKDILKQVWQYSFSTINKHENEDAILGVATQLAVEQGTGGPIAGLGYGLPMARIYARWAGGSLDLMSLDGHGCDVFLRLPDIGQVKELKI